MEPMEDNNPESSDNFDDADWKDYGEAIAQGRTRPAPPHDP